MVEDEAEDGSLIDNGLLETGGHAVHRVKWRVSVS